MLGLIFMFLIAAGLVTGAGFLLRAFLVRRVRPENAKIVSVTILVVVLILNLVLLESLVALTRAHFDEEDLIAPSLDAKMAEWNGRCETSLRVGTSAESAWRHLESTGIESLSDVEGDSRRVHDRLYYRQYRVDDQELLLITDQDVRNWRMFGDVDVNVTVRLDDRGVVRCDVVESRHGR